jgi:hypothetical protein
VGIGFRGGAAAPEPVAGADQDGVDHDQPDHMCTRQVGCGVFWRRCSGRTVTMPRTSSNHPAAHGVSGTRRSGTG